MCKFMFFFSIASFLFGIKFRDLMLSKKKRDFVFAAFGYAAVVGILALVIFQ